VEEAKHLVENIKSKWTNAPEIEVKRVEDLSPAEKAHFAKHPSQGWIEDGTGKITVIHETNATGHEVKSTVFHEALGHYGLRVKFGNDLNTVLRQIYDTNKVIREAADSMIESGRANDAVKAVEEVLADKQMEGKIPANVLQRITAAVRSFARRMGMELDFSQNDVNAILRQAHDAVVTGPKFKGEVVGEQANRAFSKDIPSKLEVTIEDADGVEKDVMARATMRAAERRVKALESLTRCLG
jgi:hypothetical protein